MNRNARVTILISSIAMVILGTLIVRMIQLRGREQVSLGQVASGDTTNKFCLDFDDARDLNSQFPIRSAAIELSYPGGGAPSPFVFDSTLTDFKLSADGKTLTVKYRWFGSRSKNATLTILPDLVVKGSENTTTTGSEQPAGTGSLPSETPAGGGTTPGGGPPEPQQPQQPAGGGSTGATGAQGSGATGGSSSQSQLHHKEAIAKNPDDPDAKFTGATIGGNGDPGATKKGNWNECKYADPVVVSSGDMKEVTVVIFLEGTVNIGDTDPPTQPRDGGVLAETGDTKVTYRKFSDGKAGLQFTISAAKSKK